MGVTVRACAGLSAAVVSLAVAGSSTGAARSVKATGSRVQFGPATVLGAGRSEARVGGVAINREGEAMAVQTSCDRAGALLPACGAGRVAVRVATRHSNAHWGRLQL